MKDKNINVEITVLSIVGVLAVALSLIVSPEASLKAINGVFDFISTAFGTPLLWYSLAATLICFYLACTRYGKIRMGEEKPEYSLFSYVGMMICAGLASASVYFSFIEWIYFYTKPAQGIEPMSVLAAEFAPAYSFNYWGLLSWPPFVLAALPIAMSYYKRNNPALRYSIVCEDLFSLKQGSLWGRIIDFLFVVTTLGGLSVTLGLGVPLISSIIAYITGIPNGFTLQVIIVIVIAVIFSLSSYVGIDKGMKRISDFNIYVAIAFVAFLFLAGPTVFLMKYITNGVALAVHNYLPILFWTDPVNNGGFSEAWIIFYICFAVAYAPLMSLFITKISRGRTVKEMILSTVLGGTFGCILLFGVNGGYGMHAQLTGLSDVIGTFGKGDSGATVLLILSNLPVPLILAAVVFCVMLILFLATSLDSASFSLAATATRNMDKNHSPSPFLRLFWCVVLALIPLGLMFAGAPLSAIQTVCLATATPFALVSIVFIWKSMRWFREEADKLEDGGAAAVREEIFVQETIITDRENT